MGNEIAKEISNQDLNEYAELLYLKRAEIVHIYQRFRKLDPNIIQDRSSRIPIERVLEEFSELCHNPFLDRLVLVFSSQKDDCFSFEDFLDLSSALSPRCPPDAKALWAFKIFDFDDDKSLKENDLMELIDRITRSKYSQQNEKLSEEEKKIVAQAILRDMDLANTGEIIAPEFSHAVYKLPEFSTSFSLKF